MSKFKDKITNAISNKKFASAYAFIIGGIFTMAFCKFGENIGWIEGAQNVNNLWKETIESYKPKDYTKSESED